MTYKETLNYLYTKLPMYQRIGKQAFKKDLTNIIALCNHLGNPQNEYECIHMAGTNGKGTVTHLMGSVLMASGKKVGFYTSPHYQDFRERIKINGVYIEEEAVVRFVDEIKEIVEEIEPSFFEITVAMAFWYFREMKVEVAMIETGLGGRLDSTNIVSPILSVITNIGYDHTHILGETLPLIAFEKAGIIKDKTPVVIGKQHKETDEVFVKKAKSHNAPIFFSNQDFEPIPTSDVSGPFASENIRTALTAINVLRTKGVEITEEQIDKGFASVRKNTTFIGRWMELSKEPLIIADAAHNKDAFSQIIPQLYEHCNGKMHFILGFVSDKNIHEVLSLLPKEANYAFVKPKLERGLDNKILKEQANELGLIGECFPTVKSALTDVQKKATNKDLIFIGGSSFLIQEIL